jgi:glycosyltransferase involved in cell wall biosynthesis
VKILHVSESLIGGPASYLQEILPFQTREFGAPNIVLLAPASHFGELAGRFDGVFAPYRRTGRNLASLLRLGWALRRAVKRHRPDVVHLHSSFAGAVGRMALMTMRRRARILYCAHCWSFDRTERTPIVRLWRTIERGLAHVTDRIINLSPHEEALLRDAGFPMQRVSLVVTGIADVEGPRPPPGRRQQGQPLRLLFLGRFDRQKGVDLLLEQYRRIDAARATLDLIGDRVVGGPQITIPAGVATHGWLSRSEVQARIAACDAVIMPSRWEAMPILAIEVLRAGRPLIGSNRGALPYIIEDGVNGIVVDIEQPDFLDRALIALEGTDLSVMGSAARCSYEQRFQSERMNASLIEVYRSLVGGAAAKAKPALPTAEGPDKNRSPAAPLPAGEEAAP